MPSSEETIKDTATHTTGLLLGKMIANSTDRYVGAALIIIIMVIQMYPRNIASGNRLLLLLLDTTVGRAL